MSRVDKLIVAWGTGPEPILDEEPATPTTIRNVSKAYKIDHKDWDVLPCDPTHNREEDILDEEGNVIGVDYGGLPPQSFLDDHEYDWSDSCFGIRPGHLKSWQPDDDYVSFQPRRVARCQRFSPHTGGEWSTVGPAISVVTSGGHS